MDIQPVVRVFRPCPALSEYVRSYTVANHLSVQPIVRVTPAYPNNYLIFYPHSRFQQYCLNGHTYEPLPQELVVGPFTQPVRLLVTQFQLTIIAHLFPGALHRLSHLPLHEIINQPFDAVNSFGIEIKTTSEQLSETENWEQMIHLIEAFLLRKVQRAKAPLPVDKIFDLLIAAPEQYNIDRLADQCYVSFRQLERQFLSRIGTTPAMFIRQARFAKAFRLKRRRPQLSWTSIAYECGYFDQMHLIRDFKLFTDSTPTAFQLIHPAPNTTS